MALKKEISKKREEAKNATVEKIADEIWKQMKRSIKSVDSFELENLEYVGVKIANKANWLQFYLIKKDAESTVEDCQTRKYLTLSSEKLEKINQVMDLVIKTAKRAELESTYVKEDRCWRFLLRFDEEVK